MPQGHPLPAQLLHAARALPQRTAPRCRRLWPAGMFARPDARPGRAAPHRPGARARTPQRAKRGSPSSGQTARWTRTAMFNSARAARGTFSDGKLNTGTHDIRNRYILEQLVRFGAGPDILLDAKPHIGTDVLVQVVQNLRQEIIALGEQVRFGARLTGLGQRDGQLHWVCYNGNQKLDWPRADPRRRPQRPGTPSPCWPRPALPWSASPLPWACASSTPRR